LADQLRLRALKCYEEPLFVYRNKEFSLVSSCGKVLAGRYRLV